jgi:hypothetical protein
MLLLSACAPQSIVVPAQPAIDLPAGQPGPGANATPVVKEVAMATLTQVPGETPATPAPSETPAQNPTPEPATPAGAETTPTTTVVELPKTLAELGIPATTFNDNVAGMAFEYPSSWLINELPDSVKQTSYIYTTSLRSKDGSRLPKQQEGIPADMAAIDVTVIYQNGPKTLEAAINERRSQATTSESGQPVKIVLEEDWVLANGLKAHRFLYNLGPEVMGSNGPDRLTSELVTMIHGREVLVVGMGDLSLFNVVAASLREK